MLVFNVLSDDDSGHVGGSTMTEPTLPTDCSIESLPLPAGARGGVTFDADPTGTYIVGYVFAPDASGETGIDPVVWHDGELTEPIEHSATPERLMAVNSDGVAIGTYSEPVGDDALRPAAFTYQHGESVKLEHDVSSQGYDINDNGGAVGTMNTPERNNTSAARFSDDGNEYLDTPDDTYSSIAYAIDEDGTIVGGIESDYPYRWNTDGEGEELTLNEDGYELEPLATSINNGTAVGSATDEDNNEVGVLWDNDDTDGTIIELEQPSTINAKGWVTGAKDDNAAVYAGGDVYDLPTLTEDSNTKYRATGISDDGHIITGNISLKDVQDAIGEPVMWTCS